MMKSGLLVSFVAVFKLTMCVMDGRFYTGRYSGGYTVKMVDKKGPKQCIRLCSKYKQCNGINYSKNDLLCELLQITSSWQPLQDSKGHFFSSRASWTMDKNSCWPNPCAENQKCVVLHDHSHLCLHADIPCIKQPCMYNGTCNTILNDFSCDCFTGFYGRYCQFTPCTTEPCQHNGTCVLSDDSYHGYTCICQLGYYGDNCETHVCDSNPCSNYGTCIPTRSTTYSCECELGYSDLQCNSYVCDSNPCSNFGTCIPTGSTTYSCECELGYSGLQCNAYVCGPNPCSNGGTCSPTGNTTFSCECASGFSGEQCSNGSCGPPRECTYDNTKTCQCDASCHLPEYNDCCPDKLNYGCP